MALSYYVFYRLFLSDSAVNLCGGESIGQSLPSFVPQKRGEESPGSIGQSAR